MVVCVLGIDTVVVLTVRIKTSTDKDKKRTSDVENVDVFALITVLSRNTGQARVKNDIEGNDVCI